MSAPIRAEHREAAREWLQRHLSAYPIGTQGELLRAGKKARENLEQLFADAEAAGFARGTEKAASVCLGYRNALEDAEQHLASIAAAMCAARIRAAAAEADPIKSWDGNV